VKDGHDCFLSAGALLPEVCVCLLLTLYAALWSPEQMKPVNGKLSVFLKDGIGEEKKEEKDI